MTYREYFRAILDRRIQTIKERADVIYDAWGKRLDRDNPAAVDDREFLEKHAVGKGVDICCGDFLIGDSIGVDIDIKVIGTDYLISGDDLTFSKAKEMDYVVSNYIETLPSTLGAMNEWHRCLKVGGVVALVCRDADSFTNREGALRNRYRCHTFNKSTIAQYLNRAGFSDVEVVVTGHHSLHATARKAE